MVVSAGVQAFDPCSWSSTCSLNFLSSVSSLIPGHRLVEDKTVANADFILIWLS